MINEQVDWDFSGPWPESYDRNRWLLTGIDDAITWAENFPLRFRGDCPLAMEQYVRRLGKMLCCHTDNTPEFHAPDCEWRRKAAELGVRLSFAQPYEPQTNGNVERHIRFQKNNIRAMCLGVDHRLWDHAARAFAHMANRLERKRGRKTPYHKRFGRKARTDYFRRFGCLAYGKKHGRAGQEGPLEDRYERGVFLGYGAENSTYLMGVWRKDAGSLTGETFTIVENATVRFNEDVLISDIEHLRAKGTFVPFQFPKEVAPQEGDVAGAEGDSSWPIGGSVASPGSRAPGSSAAPGGGSSSSWQLPGLSSDLGAPKGNQEGKEGKQEGRNEARRPVGRPPGAKSSPWGKRPGRKPMSKHPPSAETELSTEEGERDALHLYESFLNLLAVANEEEALLFDIRLTKKDAWESEDKEKWLEADSYEKLQLEALKSWRPVKEGELRRGDEIIPSVVVYTRKRNGRYKARLVALGNLQRHLSEAEIFSPTVSHAAVRYLLVESAANGWKLEQIDISNAFLNAMLVDDRVFVRLPKHWSSDPKGDVVRLLKSLYGLRISPRKWFDCYKEFLVSEGWEMCPREPGLFRKEGMWLALYVDDTILAGPDEDSVVVERDRILAHFKARKAWRKGTF